MQGFIILAIIGTEKLIVTKVDGRTDRNLNSYIAPCYKHGLRSPGAIITSTCKVSDDMFGKKNNGKSGLNQCNKAGVFCC